MGELRQIAGAVEELDQQVGSLRVALEQAEFDRRASEARAVGVLAALSDAVVGVGPSQPITLFNGAAERLFGVRRAGGHRAAPRDASPGGGSRRSAQLLARARSRLRALGDGRPSEGRPDDPGRREHGQCAPQSAPASFVMILQEAGEETLLRQSEAHFRGAFEHSASAMAIQRGDGTFVPVNRAPFAECSGTPSRSSRR